MRDARVSEKAKTLAKLAITSVKKKHMILALRENMIKACQEIRKRILSHRNNHRKQGLCLILTPYSTCLI